MINRVLSFFSSIKLTVFCLVWLTVLTFWGTLYQKKYSLYDATHTFFDSWFLTFGAHDGTDRLVHTPLPGAILILTLLFINLVVSFFAHYKAGFRMPGLMITHLGLLMLLIGGLLTRVFNVEARVDLFEGDKTNIAFSLTDWELSMWRDPDVGRQVFAIDLEDLHAGRNVTVSETGLSFRVVHNYRNAGLAEIGPDQPKQMTLVEKKPAVNVTENFPAVRLMLGGEDEGNLLDLWGLEPRPRIVKNDAGETWMLQVRRKRYELPILLELNRFSTKQLPSSSIAAFYRSDVTVYTGNDSSRPAVVEMNKPLRVAGWTFFQTSFSDKGTVTKSSFTATRNVGRLIPYYAVFITSLGLFAHFIQMQILDARRAARKGGAA